MRCIITLLGSLFILSGCSDGIIEYNEFSRVKRDHLQVYLSPTIVETKKKTAYGNPYDLKLSYKNEQNVEIDVDLWLKNKDGKIVARIQVSGHKHKADKFMPSFLAKKKINVDYSDHFLEGTYEIKRANGTVQKGVLKEKIEYSHRIDYFPLPE